LFSQALFYDFIDQEAEAEKTMAEAKQAHLRNASRGAPSIYMTAADFLLKCKATQLTERALAQELLTATDKVEPYLLLSRLKQQQGNLENALELLKKTLDANLDNPEVWAAFGHFHYGNKQFKDAQAAYETLLSLPLEPRNIALVYYRLGNIYFSKGKENDQVMNMAKTMFLRACVASPTANGWLGVGKACYHLQEFVDAEDALSVRFLDLSRT
jgi:tetratricopeptide (TPR) repeat protein